MAHTVEMTYTLTDKGLKEGYTSDFFADCAKDLNRHNYCNDDAYIYVLGYCEQNTSGIRIMATIDTINWFVKYWIESGIVKALD